ncbi:recombinase family protein [Flavisolibacter nicotianae]|uniref:recombinase family protein n=1 Tax=Flavisolibacter nicotianae TaxID=2364882 RepID=UPI0037445047
MKRAILMARVSSDEQAKGYSLDIQVDKLSSHCAREGIQIINTYREDHSAKNFNRPEFKKILSELKAIRGKVDLLLVTTWDRFSRNVTESYAVLDTLKQLGVEVQAIEQPLDLSIPENLLILGVYLNLPDIDNRRRSIKITEGVRAAAAAGRWQGKAPYGYRNARDEGNKPIIVPSDKAAVVKEIYSQLASGRSQAEVREVLKKKGVVIPRATFSVIARNRVYIGEIHVRQGGGKTGGYYVKGLHQPLIETDVFEKVQALLQGNYRVKQLAKPKAFCEELPLRGLLLCENCGRNLTGSASRSHTGDRHYYYHCNNCKTQRLRAEQTHDMMLEILSGLKVNSPAKKLYEAMVKKLLQKRKTETRPLASIQADLQQVETRLQTLDDNLMDKVIDAATYASVKSRYSAQLQKLQTELTQQGSSQSEFQQFLKRGIHMLENLPVFYQKSSGQTKRDVVGSIFPEKLVLSKNGCRTQKINEAVLLIATTDKGFSKKEKGQLLPNVELSNQVAPTGIEPVSGV